ncbi:UPF0147 family protein [Candidatus Woesearchaeota archaeon]|nr:UPF0147 family protein [Candidatus Woesearchaeota archaeon]
MNVIEQVLAALQELECDDSVPRNVKSKIVTTIGALNQDCECSIKVSKALAELEELTEDANIEAHTRSQLFNIVSLLEVA